MNTLPQGKRASQALTAFSLVSGLATIAAVVLIAGLLLVLTPNVELNFLRCDHDWTWLGDWDTTAGGGYRAWTSCSPEGAANLSEVSDPYFTLGIAWQTYEGYVETITWSEEFKKQAGLKSLDGFVGDTNWRPPSSDNVIGARLYTVVNDSPAEEALLSEYGSMPWSLEASIQARIERKGGVCEGFCLDYVAMENQLQPNPEGMTTYIISLPTYLRQKYTEANGWTCIVDYRYKNTDKELVDVEERGRLAGQKCYFDKPADLYLLDLRTEPTFSAVPIPTTAPEPDPVPPFQEDSEPSEETGTTPEHDDAIGEVEDDAPQPPSTDNPARGWWHWILEWLERIGSWVRGLFV